MPSRKSGRCAPSVGCTAATPCAATSSPRRGSASSTSSPSAPTPRPKACSLNGTTRHAVRGISPGFIQFGSPTSRHDTLGAVYANGASATS